MQTAARHRPYVALAAVALSLALLVLVLVPVDARVRRLRRSQLVVMGHHEQRDIVAHVESLDSQVRNLREAVEILTDQLDGQKRHLDHALTNRAIVRYDAFRDAGGEQSASFALLDNHRSGVVFSAIAARDFARIYVKHLQTTASPTATSRPRSSRRWLPPCRGRWRPARTARAPRGPPGPADERRPPVAAAIDESAGLRRARGRASRQTTRRRPGPGPARPGPTTAPAGRLARPIPTCGRPATTADALV